MDIGLGKARGLGAPRTDVERIMAHYNISREEAERWLQIHPEEMLLPARGAGLTRGTAAGIGSLGDSTGIIVLGSLVAATFVGLGFLALLSSRKG